MVLARPVVDEARARGRDQRQQFELACGERQSAVAVGIHEFAKQAAAATRHVATGAVQEEVDANAVIGVPRQMPRPADPAGGGRERNARGFDARRLEARATALG